MLMLACLPVVIPRKPDLDAGIYAMPSRVWRLPRLCLGGGYWIGCCLADVACLVLIKATLGQFFPILAMDDTHRDRCGDRAAMGRAFPDPARHQGSRGAQYIATFAKIVPILLFIVVVIFAFKAEFLGRRRTDLRDVSSQVRNTIAGHGCSFSLESKAQVSTRAMQKPRRMWDRNAVLGFLGVLALLVLVQCVVCIFAASGAEGVATFPRCRPYWRPS